MKGIISHSKLVVACLLLAILSSCFDDSEFAPDGSITYGIRHDKSLSAYEQVASNAAPYNGDSYPDFSSVVAFEYSLDGSSNGDFVATGVLIDSEWILTAAHNFFTEAEQTSLAPASGIKVLVGNDPNNPDREVSVSQIVFHPTWIDEDEEYADANDICLVRLSSPITTITPASINTATEDTGSTVWYSGFGDYSQEEGQNPDLLSKKHAIENVLDRVRLNLTSGSNPVYEGGLLAFDFDSPEGGINSLGDDFSSEDEILLGSGSSSANPREFEGTTVEGDSGGPLFIETDGQWKVCGILSGGAAEPIPGHSDSSYGDISIFIRVASHVDWINSVVN